MSWKVMGWIYIVLVFLGLVGCTADQVDKYVANSTSLAKEQTAIILDDNAKQTEALTEQHKVMAPEVAAAIDAAILPYKVENAKLKEQVAAMHHEVSKLTEELSEQMAALADWGLGFLGVGGVGGAFAVGKKSGKKAGSGATT